MASGFQHPVYFVYGIALPGEILKSSPADDEIEGLLRKWHRGGVPLAEIHLAPAFRPFSVAILTKEWLGSKPVTDLPPLPTRTGLQPIPLPPVKKYGSSHTFLQFRILLTGPIKKTIITLWGQ